MCRWLGWYVKRHDSISAISGRCLPAGHLRSRGEMGMAQELSPTYRKLQQQTSKATNEEEVRLVWVRALEEATGITFDAERGKRDLSYNNVVIEFKDLGKFNGKTSSPAFREAMEERLLPYILRAAKADHIDERDYIGIAIDGEHLAFAQVVD